MNSVQCKEPLQSTVKIRTTLPAYRNNLRPKWPNNSIIKGGDEAAKEKQAYYFNRQHGLKDLPVLRPGDSVLLKLDQKAKRKGPAMGLVETATPKSYEVFSEKEGQKWRNHGHLQLLTEGVPGITVKTGESSEVQSPQKVTCRVAEPKERKKKKKERKKGRRQKKE
ncbi:hypothetical protein QQF64_025737 [Cirrhinus molitorella]|uniref:Uncharacterized protein n=1 Tax=Cirrhinus molitorella TaxID=172907 RepID=A0ABR3NQ63_9TELE